MRISPVSRKRVLIFIVAYNAERTIQHVLSRIPRQMADFDTEVLIIDDSSHDRTFEVAREYRKDGLPFPIRVLYNPVNQGYGGNQKLGFHYALRQQFDYVVLLHGDGQYAPEEMPRLIKPLIDGEADAVFGSRMMERARALKGGMPLYKYVGNKILTGLQNRLLGCALSEFHSGYRLYATAALAQIPFERNSNDFHFDTEIIIQLLRAGLRIRELPIPTYYGDEICRVNGVKYAFNVLKASVLARAQEFGVWYERKFDVRESIGSGTDVYQPKLNFTSPHTMTLERIPEHSTVLDLGCASGHMARALKRKACFVTGVDSVPIADRTCVEKFLLRDLNDPLDIDAKQFQYVAVLDVVEHLRCPEEFIEQLRFACGGTGGTKVIFSSGNVAFIVTRLMLLLGYFNYGTRGILDLTHTRLFTFGTARRLFEQSGYRVEEIRGVPAPFPLALGDCCLARTLLKLNKGLIGLSKRLFSYQIFMVVRPLPSVDALLEQTVEATSGRIAEPRRLASAHSAA